MSATTSDTAPPAPPPLPLIEDAYDFTAVEHKTPPELIWGVLHKGCKLAVGGGSKTHKTWLLMDLAASVAYGEPWLSMKTTQARVCYLNLELHDWALESRLDAILKDKHIKTTSASLDGGLDLWNLRGHATGYQYLLPQIADSVRLRNYGLIIVDPLYKFLGDADENSARDISSMLNGFERLAKETGAGIAFAAHFSKGNQAAKESIDRISGSGCFARDPDAILTLTRHENDGAFTVEATLRNHSPMKPFVISWLHPLMRRSDELDPANIKQPKRGGGSVKKFTLDTIIDCLGKRKLKTAAFQKRCLEETGMSRAMFYSLLNEGFNSKKIIKNNEEECEIVESPNESK